MKAQRTNSTCRKACLNKETNDKLNFSCLIKQPERPKPHVKVTSEFFHANEGTMQSIEAQIVKRYETSPVEKKKNMKRFQQLKEYLKMSYRDVKINHNLKNEQGRIVKGELPLGTDTHIKHEVRENYPQIREIKRRLKNCLKIHCDFNEVIKYAKEFYSTKGEDQTISRLLFKEKAKLKLKPAPEDDQIDGNNGVEQERVRVKVEPEKRLEEGQNKDNPKTPKSQSN